MCMVLLSWVIKLFWVSPEGNLFHFRLAVHYTLSKTLNVSLSVSIILMFCCTILHAIRIWRYSWEAIINVILLGIFSFDLKPIRYGVLSKVIFFSIGIVTLYGFLFSSFLTSHFFSKILWWISSVDWTLLSAHWLPGNIDLQNTILGGKN